jgi:hypothetical protein
MNIFYIMHQLILNYAEWTNLGMCFLFNKIILFYYVLTVGDCDSKLFNIGEKQFILKC